MKLANVARRAGLVAASFLMIGAVATWALSVQVARSGWSWANPTPQGNSLFDVDFHGGLGFAVGASGTALKTGDGGATWSGLATGTPADLHRLQIVDPSTLVVLGGNGCVLRRSADGGATFQKIFIVAESNCPDQVQSFYFTDKSNGYLLLHDGSILKTADGGQTFSKQTALPGTPASATGGNAVPTDLYFSSATSGLVVVTPPGGTSLAYTTTDGGVSWTPLTTVPPGSVVTRLYEFDAQTIYAVGPNTLLRSIDGGATFQRRNVGDGLTLTSIHCATPTTCLLTTDQGTLERTTDGGDTATPITASSVPLAAAAFGSPMRAVGVGAAGQMVISSDGGVDYTPLGRDLGATFLELRAGPVPSMALAPATKGQIGVSTDSGATWTLLSVPTSGDIADTSWSDQSTGYAIDARGGLFSTANAGKSWQTLSPGPGGTASAVEALPSGGAVLLVGPRGVRRSVGGGAFQPVAGRPVAQAALDHAQMAGGAVVAWGYATRNLLVSVNAGASWRAMKLPGSKHTRVALAAFVNGAAGYLLDTTQRLWTTGNGGRSWRELIGAGTSAITGMSFGSASDGFLTIRGLAGDPSVAYTLHTVDGGRSWTPQAISPGVLGTAVEADPSHAYAMVAGPGSLGAQRQLFFSASDGSAGSASSLRIGANPPRFRRKALHRAHGRVTVSGVLAGAVGGERVVVSARPLTGGSWSSQVVTAGANGGSFSAGFVIHGSEVFVAQWAGDSGRAGAATAPRVVVVKKK